MKNTKSTAVRKRFTKKVSARKFDGSENINRRISRLDRSSSTAKQSSRDINDAMNDDLLDYNCS